MRWGITAHGLGFIVLLAVNLSRAGARTAPAHFDEVAPCPFPTGAVPESRLTCGYLDVPETRGKRNGQRLRLPVVRIRAEKSGMHDDPVVFLHGGPGAAPLESGRTIERFAAHPFAASRDIVLFNQRGSAQTLPPLACHALNPSLGTLFTEAIDFDTRNDRIAAAARQCLNEVAAAGRDLSSYGAMQAAADLRDLREALGIKHWNILAVSYGTLIALEAARIDERGIRSLIMDSVVSPQSDLFMSEGARNFSAGLDSLLESCVADAACAADFPDPGGQLREVIGRLKKQPVTVTVAGPGVEGRIDMVVNWYDFLGGIHWMLYNAQTLRMVPLLIDRTWRGDYRTLAYVMDHVFPALRNGASAPTPAFLAFVCQDQYVGRTPRRQVSSNAAYGGFSITSFMARACAGIPRDFRAGLPPVRSRLPALLLSGRFDPMTPKVYAQQVAADLPNSTLAIIGDSGHSTLSDFKACQTRLALAFIDTLSASSPCLSSPAHPVFLRSVEDLQRIR